MRPRRYAALALCLALTSCSTTEQLERRPLSDGISRTFPGKFDIVATAVDEAVETLPVNIAAPVTIGKTRIVHFNRPLTSGGYGDRGRVVIVPIDQDTTRVTVTVSSWDPLALTERVYAGHVFRDVEARVMPPERFADSR